MPQEASQANISPNSKPFMSTFLIQGQPEPEKILVQSVPVNDGKKLVKKLNPTQIGWEELAGLSWILLNKEEEI